MNEQRTFLRAGGIGGIAFVVILLVAMFSVPAPPATDAGVAEVRDYVLENRSGLLLQGVLYGLALAALLVFLEALRRRFAEEPAAAPFATVGALASALFFTLALVGGACFGAAAWVKDDLSAMGDDAFRITWNLGYLCYLMAFPLAALSLLAAAWCAHRSGAFKLWYTVVVAVLGVLLLIATVGATSPGAATVSFPAFLGYLLFVLISAILLVAKSGGRATPEAAAG